MLFNRLTLSFSGHHAHLESVFHDHYFYNTLNQIRIAIFAGLIFYGAFGLLDALVLPDRYQKLWMIRWAIVCPSLFIVLLFSYSRYAYRFFQPMLSFGTIVCGLGIVAMVQISAPDQNNAYESGLVQIIFFIFTFARLRFIWGTSAACFLVVAYLIVIVSENTMPNNVIIARGFHYSLICLMGMMAGYAIEYQTRKTFFLSLQLESKKRRLAITNEFLEERVAKRTQEQKRTNALLREEINERKIIESALRDSRMRFQNIFETAAAGMAIIEGHSQRVVEINSAAAQMLADDADHIKGQHLDQLIAMPKDAATRRLPLPTPYPVECVLNRTAESCLPILASTRETVFDDKPHAIVSFINIQKIKEAEATQRELEKRSNQAQHLESIGTLAGGIAHDFNNILFGILGFAELALEDADKDSILANNLNEILRGGHRAKEMIRQILTFSRQDSVEKQILDPAPLVKEAQKLLRASIPSTIDIKSRFAPKLHTINANPTHIHQVVMNLCTNAAHSMDDGTGCIDICVDNVNLPSHKETPHGQLAKGDYVQLVVKDNGKGIAHNIIDRIYEPFFTTKSQGRGTGMGLSVVLGIVQAIGGTIRVESHPGKGTRFELLFPAAQNENVESVVPATPLPKGNEHILVVDDERPLLIMLDRMLIGLGYKVTTCEHALEALKLIKRQPGAYDLVITDLTMPKMTGVQLARELLQIRPDLSIILSTGYNEKISDAHLQTIGIRQLLPKPITRRDLASAIRQAIEAN